MGRSVLGVQTGEVSLVNLLGGLALLEREMMLRLRAFWGICGHHVTTELQGNRSDRSNRYKIRWRDG